MNFTIYFKRLIQALFSGLRKPVSKPEALPAKKHSLTKPKAPPRLGEALSKPEVEVGPSNYDVENTTPDDEDGTPHLLEVEEELEEGLTFPIRRANGYLDHLPEPVLDKDFYDSLVDLTKESNVKDSKGRRRRKGVRKWERLVRLVWHQTAFRWSKWQSGKRSSHHKMRAHICIDVDGKILLIHNFMYYLWTANVFNKDCISIEIMGNFEGVQGGSADWYKPSRFGKHRPFDIQLIRARQLTAWLLDPSEKPIGTLPKPMEEWRKACAKLEGSPIKFVNAHNNATDDRPIDPGSEVWYNVCEWAIQFYKQLSFGGVAGRGKLNPPEWSKFPKDAPISYSE